jgi:hypothetical protein
MKPYKPRPYPKRHSILNTLLIFLATVIITVLLTWITCRYASAAPATANTTDTPLIGVEYIGTMRVTGYVPWDAAQCGNDDGLGANPDNPPVIPGEHVAMVGIPFGTKVVIVGLGEFTVNDRGPSGIVDVACRSDAECYETTGNYPVYIIN